MGNRLEMPRRRGSVIGTLLLLAGVWGAAIPFVGPYFDWVVGPDNAFDMTEGRFWLSLVPGLAVIAGALVLTGTANRLSAGTGAWIALAGGAWFVVGPTVGSLIGAGFAGEPLGGESKQAFERLTYYEGLGALIVALAALALGRMTVRDHRTVDAETHEVAHDAPREPTGRFTRPDREEETAPAAVGAGEERPAMRHTDEGRRHRPIL